MTSSRPLGCCRSKTWRITSRIGACQVCLHLMFMFTDVCACEIRRREVNEACRCACPDGIAPSKVSTSDDACVDPFLISAKSVTLLSRPHTPSTAFRHLPPNSARFSYATEGALFISRAAVQRCGQRPPNSPGTNMTVEAT